MARGLDHIVHAVRDLEGAADRYRQLGFAVGARNRHPWGTHNHIVQLPGFFIELLTVSEPEKLGADVFSTLFGAYNRDFLTRAEGYSLLILESKNAREDEGDYRAAGILAAPALRFEREGKRPDGTTVKVGFSLAFAEDKASPDIHFAACQQHYPENFWNPAFQKHANGTTAVAGVVAVDDEPENHRQFLAAFAGAPAAAVSGGLTIETPRGTIEMLTPTAFSQRYAVPAPDVSRGARLAALRLLTDAEALASLADIGGINRGGRTVIGPENAMGAVLIFEAARRAR
jgi:hypothetical protein